MMRIARRIGGVVLPTIYHGTGGGHHEFEWTWMVDQGLLVGTLLATLHGLDRSGIRLVVILSGHLPNQEIYDELIERFREQGGKADVLTLSDADAFGPNPPRRIDHASKWEASYLLAMMAQTVDLESIQSDEPIAAPEEDSGQDQWWFIKDSTHPWYGIAGMGANRPTDASLELGEACVEQVVDWGCEQVSERMAEVNRSA